MIKGKGKNGKERMNERIEKSIIKGLQSTKKTHKKKKTGKERKKGTEEGETNETDERWTDRWANRHRQTD